MKYKYDYDNLAIQAFNLFMSGNYNNIVRQILEVPSHVFLKVRRVLAVRLQHQGWTGPEIHRLINSRGKGICGNRDIPTGYSLEAIGITCYSSLLEWEASALAVQDAQNQYALAGLDEVKRRLYEVNNNKLLYSADKIDEAELYVFIHAKGMKIGSIPWECEMSGSISDIIGYISPNDIFNFG